MNTASLQNIIASPLSNIMGREPGRRYQVLAVIAVIAVNHEEQLSSYIHRSVDQWGLITTPVMDCARITVLVHPTIH